MVNLEYFDEFRKNISCYSFAEEYASVLSNLAALYRQDIEYVDPEPVVRLGSSESTMFTSSGIQFMNRYIKGELPFTENAYLISQPVVRMNYLPNVSLGSYTTFINFGSMIMNTSFDYHLTLSDEYSDLISETSSKKFHKSGITERTYERDGFEYTTLQENYSLDNLEVGDSLFHYIKLDDGQTITMSEMGGGLERLLGGTSPNIISESTGIPDVDSDNISEIDGLRGAILIAANNVIPSNNNHGYQLRRLVKHLPVEVSEAEEYIDMLMYDDSIYMFWQRLGGVMASREISVETVKNEIRRNTNLHTLKKAGMQQKSKMDFSLNPTDFAQKYNVSI